MEIKDVRTLKDILIMALRYALPRHTYAVSEAIEFIMQNQELIDSRVKIVMLRDVIERLNASDDTFIEDIDLPTIIKFRNWLQELEVS